jgi:hypothetical protein
MRGATPVNDEFEVGFDQDFENRWYIAELCGRVVMIVFVICGLAGLLGRGPFSHARAYAPGGGMYVDYEPVARHGTSTTVTVHVRNDTPDPRPVTITIGQHMIEPMGFQHAIPLPDASAIQDGGIRQTFMLQPHDHDALIRFELSPNAIGPVHLIASDGDSRVDWSVFVAP